MALGDSMRAALNGFPKQFAKGLELAEGVPAGEASSCALLGMGGSAITGDLLNSWLPELGMRVVRDYSAPGLNSETLTFACSYSGNTEETLSAFEEAFAAGAQLVVFASGGKLAERAEEEGLPLVLVPSGLQPRCAIGYFFAGIARVLSEAGFVPEAALDELSALRIEADETAAKKRALTLKGKIPLFYSSERWLSVARACKIKFNENAKTPSFYAPFPEFNHNEMNGFENSPARFTAFLFEDAGEEKIVKRMEATKKILDGKLGFVDFPLEGTDLEKIFSTLYYFDWVSFHLALAYKVDPEAVPVVEKFKKLLT
ncbi:MAG: bifunctional phosphoglucose/phosphomannose isomerase [Candidatus Micrarchaeia archaeon]